MSSTALSTESIISIGAVTWAVALPFLPNQVHQLLRHPVAAFVLLAVALVALPYGPIPGVLVLLAVLLTFVERNRITIKNSLLEKAGGGEAPTYQEQLQPSLPMDPNEVHPLPTLPSLEEHPFMPNDEMGDNAFEPVAASQDEKNVIQTISSTPDVAGKFFLNQGLASTKLAGDP
jgi:hypothetical protein